MSAGEIILAITAASIALILTRSLGFIFFASAKSGGKLFTAFQENMPIMIIVILIFVTLQSANFGVAQIVGSLAAIAAHLIFKNALVTIALSTAVCLTLAAVI
ncbi:MAG: AzlD domain-containing protein [Helicobacteraceae bacterium]|nr:AzlD domain-containing protein [Helicobacteraceae bacterium]